MIEIPFTALQAAIARPTFGPKPAGVPKPGVGIRQLSIPETPQPFVPPSLNEFGSRQTMDVEIIFVQAPAAVGKSTIARFLSASGGVPFLDLAKVPVSTGSLKALISDLVGDGDPIESFHAGQLPIIIDALDEGRLLSGETGFESFLLTSAELLLADRRATNKPKLIIFGRSDSTELAKVAVELGSDGNIFHSVLEIGFFGEDGAKTLIHEYAKRNADSGSAYVKHPGPVREVVDAYFAAIEAALSLPAGDLWKSERGKTFAGYAPVLAAVGTLLAEMDNFSQVATQLRDAGAREAWGVIEKVLNEILDRERTKLCTQLQSQIPTGVPEEAYDREEQLTLLSHYVHGRGVHGSGRVQLAPMIRASTTRWSGSTCRSIRSFDTTILEIPFWPRWCWPMRYSAIY